MKVTGERRIHPSFLEKRQEQTSSNLMSEEGKSLSIFPSQREEWPCVLCNFLLIFPLLLFNCRFYSIGSLGCYRAPALFKQVIISQWLSHYQKTYSFKSLLYTTLFKIVDFFMVLILSTLRSYSHFKHRDHGTHNSLPPKLVQIPSWGQDLPCPHHPHSSDHPLYIYSSLMHSLQLCKQAWTLNDCNMNHNDNK